MFSQPYSGDLNDHFSVFNGFCKQLELNATKESVTFNLIIQTQFGNSTELQVLLADPGSSPYFMINPETLTGDTVATIKNSVTMYVIDVEQVQLMPDSEQCTMYGEEAEFKE